MRSNTTLSSPSFLVRTAFAARVVFLGHGARWAFICKSPLHPQNYGPLCSLHSFTLCHVCASCERAWRVAEAGVPVDRAHCIVNTYLVLIITYDGPESHVSRHVYIPYLILISTVCSPVTVLTEVRVYAYTLCYSGSLLWYIGCRRFAVASLHGHT